MKRYWYKTYVQDILSKERMQMPDWLFRRLVEFEAFAADYGAEGLLPPVKDMAWILRPVEETKLSEALQSLSEVGEAEQTPEGWRLTHFEERQRAAGKPIDLPGHEHDDQLAGVYGIQCQATGKWYVGASLNVYWRIKTHFYEMNYYGSLFEAAQQFGVHSMKAEVLEFVDDINKLQQQEAYWINKLDSITNGYNRQSSRINAHWRKYG
jgi:GIY-YIG catalytic domain-containing protein